MVHVRAYCAHSHLPLDIVYAMSRFQYDSGTRHITNIITLTLLHRSSFIDIHFVLVHGKWFLVGVLAMVCHRFIYEWDCQIAKKEWKAKRWHTAPTVTRWRQWRRRRRWATAKLIFNYYYMRTQKHTFYGLCVMRCATCDARTSVDHVHCPCPYIRIVAPNIPSSVRWLCLLRQHYTDKSFSVLMHGMTQFFLRYVHNHLRTHVLYRKWTRDLTGQDDSLNQILILFFLLTESV